MFTPPCCLITGTAKDYASVKATTTTYALKVRTEQEGKDTAVNDWLVSSIYGGDLFQDDTDPTLAVAPIGRQWSAAAVPLNNKCVVKRIYIFEYAILVVNW